VHNSGTRKGFVLQRTNTKLLSVQDHHQGGGRCAKRELQQTTTNVARSYLKGAYQEAFAARQRELEGSAVVKSELRKLKGSDVGTATLQPKTSSGNETFRDVDNPAGPVAQLRALAEEQRKQNAKLSMSQAYDRVYADVKNRKLIEAAMELRTPSLPRLLDPKPPI
jgi:hypothetical protein